MSSALASRVRDTAPPGPAQDRVSRCLLFAGLLVQAAHLGSTISSRHSAVASNVIQTIVPALSAAICGLQAWRSGTRRQRRLWLQLSLAFVFWAAGQLLFLWMLLGHTSRAATLASDSLWLAFCLPLLIVAASPPATARRDRVGWLDLCQSCLLFGILCVLIFPHHGIIRVPLAYNVEDMAAFLAILLRYSIAQPGEERAFYRGLALFTGCYAGFTALGYALLSRGAPDGGPVDLCWTLPFTAFSLLALTGPGFRPRLERWTAAGAFSLARYLQGVSALGMAVMSLAGSFVLARHSLSAGIPAVAISFLLFAARTSTREWQLHATHAHIEHAVLHDPLTGLPNRAMLQQQLSGRLHGATAQARRRPALLFIDLDRFKTINDGLGHSFGDLLLVEVVGRLKRATCAADLLARHGGDEFVILLSDVDEHEAELAAARVTAALRTPLHIEGRTLHVTASIGVVLGQPDATAESMLQDADCAMYNAKAGGRDRAQTFTPDMLQAAKRRLELETDLRKALESGGIEVHYQPIFAVEPRSLRGFEALVRWRHPERGMVSPADFIPVAEDSGLVLELGRQVLHQACRQCHAWQQSFGSRLYVAVNFSVHQFSEPGLPAQIAATLASSGLDPAQLKIEITESVLVNNYQAVEDVLKQVRAMGVGVCLDDFGTGYSSLSYLLRFPFDVVKIDRGFIQGLDSDPRQAELVRMIVQLAALLEKETVAEGVETEAELACLREFGCDLVQGFLLARPMPAEAVTAMLAGGALLRHPDQAPAPVSALGAPRTPGNAARNATAPLRQLPQVPSPPLTAGFALPAGGAPRPPRAASS